MAEPTIPHPDDEFDVWFNNFNTQFALVAIGLGFTAADVTAVNTAYTYWHSKYLAAVAAKAAATSAVEAKDAQRGSSEATARSYVGQAQKKPGMTDATRALLQINIRKAAAPIPPPEGVPLVRLDWSVTGRMRIHFGTNPDNEHLNKLPAGSRSAMIEFYQGTTPPAQLSDWRFLAIDTNSPYVHVFAAVAPTMFFYRVAYMNAKGEQGPWSATASGMISA